VQPQEYRSLHDVKIWRARVADAMRGAPLPAARDDGRDTGA
jgi:hypothetical protein